MQNQKRHYQQDLYLREKSNSNCIQLYNNLQDAAKSMLREKFKILKAYIRKKKISQINNISSHFNKLEKSKNKPKPNRIKEKENKEQKLRRLETENNKTKNVILRRSIKLLNLKIKLKRLLNNQLD